MKRQYIQPQTISTSCLLRPVLAALSGGNSNDAASDSEIDNDDNIDNGGNGNNKIAPNAKYNSWNTWDD